MTDTLPAFERFCQEEGLSYLQGAAVVLAQLRALRMAVEAVLDKVPRAQTVNLLSEEIARARKLEERLSGVPVGPWDGLALL